MTRVTYDGTAPVVYERSIGAGMSPPYRHARHPEHPTLGVCGARLRERPAPDARDCVFCEAMIAANRVWISR